VFLKALVFFEDAEHDGIAGVDERWDEVKGYFVRLVKSAVIS